MGKKFVYLFKEGNADMRELLGGKGANLAEMTNLGLPVPQGFTITTEACTQYYEDGRRINDDIQAEIMATIPKLEEITGKKFGDEENPLLVSVRSGARASMPGMMDTILNLGLNERVVNVIAEKSNNPRWAWDCYRRFIQMFSDVVMEVGKKYFEKLIDKMKTDRGVTQDVELSAEDLKELAMQAQYNPVHSEHITAESTYTIRNNAYSFGCTFAEVEVDIPMCKVTLKNIVNVHDCGKLINPALAAAQVHGGMSMGIGYGLSEQLIFDEKTGKPLNGNLLDYKLSTILDHPHLEAEFIENPEPTSPFGTKALGEPPVCSCAPAIRNAILDATGVAIDHNPINPHVLFAEFSKAGLIRDDWREEEK